MSNTPQEGRLRRFYKKHPKFRVAIAKIDSVLHVLEWGVWLILAIIVIGIILLCYFCLPSKINEIVSIVVGGGLTALGFPAVIEYQRLVHDRNLAQIERCYSFHEELLKYVFEMLRQKGNWLKEREISKKIVDHIAENYPMISLCFTQKQIDALYFLRDECDMLYRANQNERPSMDTFQFCAQRYLDYLRRQGFSFGKAFLNDPLGKKSEVQP